ncbi:hypothetical protein R3P38DRAFT_2780705 [Favolaschia claudopus]|uniref:Uncharacterized protein n=1 Tax=Favolaschia claudopus TaxID=2862362 RepID=A0AAW0B758_9AGAR
MVVLTTGLRPPPETVIRNSYSSADTQAKTVSSQGGRGSSRNNYIQQRRVANVSRVCGSCYPGSLSIPGLSGTSMIALIAGLTALLLSRRKKGKAKLEETTPVPARVASINPFIIDHPVPWASPPPYTTSPGSSCVVLNGKFQHGLP